jgi:2-iminobutanoate/2-iminopropanoate deaminase
MKTILSTKEAPAAIGPYSQAVRVGDFLFVSGQIPLDPQSGEIVGETAPEQLKQVIRNLRGILQEAGMNLRNVVKATLFLRDMADFAAVNEVYAQYFANEPPARSTVAVLGLPKDVRVELEAIAAL